MVDNPKDKDSKVEGKDNPETWTPPVGQEWLNEKFSKAEKPVEEQAKAYAEAENRLRKVEAELNTMKEGGVTNFNEAMLAEKEDELAKLKKENEALKKPQSDIPADKVAYIKEWHSRLASEDPVVAARAFQEGIAGEIYRYDQKKKAEEQSRNFQHQIERATSMHSKEELDTLAPYVYQIRKERPELERSPHGVEDILDKAKVRLAEDKKALEVEDAGKTAEKEQIGSINPTDTEPLTKELKWEDIENMSIQEREQLLREHGIKYV